VVIGERYHAFSQVTLFLRSQPCAVILDDPRKYVHFYDIHLQVYNWVFETYQIEVSQNDITMSLEYLQNIGFIQSDTASYRLTGSGKYQIENPQPNYEALGLEEQQKSNNITTISLYIAAISLCVAIASLYVAWLAWTGG
jgi:hypothetical protein